MTDRTLSPLTTLAPLAFLCLLLCLSSGLSGCSTVLSSDPPLADSTFTRLLVDLHLTKARGDQFSKLPAGVSDSLFIHHSIEREDFNATLRYYSNRPEAFESLYDAVIDTLNALQTRSPSRSNPTSGNVKKVRPSAP